WRLSAAPAPGMRQPVAQSGRPAPPRARDALIRAQPAESAARDWENPAARRRRPIAKPWEGGHSLAWLAWMIGGLLTASQTSQPLYLALIWGCALLTATACASEGPLAGAWHVLLRVGAVLFALHLLFSVVTAGFLRGQTVLATLPTWTLPKLLGGLQLGGPITLEQLVSGATRGLRLWTVLLIVGAFNASVNHYRLLRRTPRILLHAGLIVTIALAFVPQTVLRLRAVRDAQRLRGHRFRSWRDALPLMIPLLSGGLERALLLAESMEARGYGRGGQPGRRSADTTTPAPRLAALGGLALLMLGTFLFLFYPAASAGGRIGGAGLLTGTALLIGSWWMGGRAIRQTRYLRERWGGASAAVALLGLAAPAGLWLCGRAGVELQYRIFPLVGLPAFEPLAALPLLLLSAPAWLLARPAARASR
ncbi:MAG TPA: energy-coupling factor transporter transmembrane component T, partial [Herpetosiphonaceae bacterium]